MSQLNTLLESAGQGWKNLQSDAARLASKWEKTGLLEGLGNETNKNNMSLMLENQAKQLVVEASSTGASTTGILQLVLVISGLESLYHWYVRYLVKSLLKNSFLYSL